MEEKFTLKKAVSLTLALSFLVMSYTGIMLFFTPKGKIANWTDWTLLGLSKTQYTDLHITMLFLFLATGIWHIYFNWKPLTSYLKNKSHRFTVAKKELLLALALNGLFVGGTLMHLPPMQSIVNLNTAIKNYWEREQGAPPFGHAEEATPASLAAYGGFDAETALQRLKAEGILVKNADQTLQQIAVQNRTTAKRIYDLMVPQKQRHAASPVSSLGRRSLEELAEMGYINLDDSVAYLKVKGVDATPQTRMREAADALGTTPYELFKSLKTETSAP